jgi:very-short-patch-repair endonuclease
LAKGRSCNSEIKEGNGDAGKVSPFVQRGTKGDFMLRYNNYLKRNSRRLRKNMTDAEKLLWSKIRGKQLKGLQIYRQKPIGRFIVDFYCPKASLVVELDGGQHYSEALRREDHLRDKYLESVGLRVLRFSDRDVFENLTGVLEKLWNDA